MWREKYIRRSLGDPSGSHAAQRNYAHQASQVGLFNDMSLQEQIASVRYLKEQEQTAANPLRKLGYNSNSNNSENWEENQEQINAEAAVPSASAAGTGLGSVTTLGSITPPEANTSASAATTSVEVIPEIKKKKGFFRRLANKLFGRKTANNAKGGKRKTRRRTKRNR